MSYDVGLDGKYDLRRRIITATSRDRSGAVKSQVLTGVELVCRGERLGIMPGKYMQDGQEKKTKGGEVTVLPVEIVEIKDLPMKLVAEPAQTWHLGNRLIISPQDREHPAGQLRARFADRARSEASGYHFLAPRDYTIDNQWGRSR